MAQPTTRRLQASITTARYRFPVHVETYVIPATHNLFGPAAVKLRWTRSAAGRFLTSRFEGFSTSPVSLNAYPYAYDNPLLYTDASGRNPVLALAAGIAGGFALGVAAGGLFGALTYDWALAGECGCDMQQRALTMSRWDWIGTNALSGGILGGAAVAISALVGLIGPGALIAVSGLGLVVSVADFINTVEIIVYETGLTACTAIRLLIDVAGIVLSGYGIVQGVRAWQASGSLLNWAPARTLPGRWETRWGSGGEEYEEWVRQQLGNPSNQNLYVDNGQREVRFDAWNSRNGTLIDAKSSNGSSIYDKVFEEWAQPSVLREALDQIAAGEMAMVAK